MFLVAYPSICCRNDDSVRGFGLNGISLAFSCLTDKEPSASLRLSFCCFGVVLIEGLVEKKGKMVASEVQNSELICTKSGIDFEPDQDLKPMDPAKYLFSISKITENLFLCGACALRADTFEKLGITCVINCTTRDELPDPPIADNITYLRIPVLDSTRTNLSQYFHTITDAIQNANLEGGRVLVHCIAGVSRSASICLAFLIKHHNMSLREAYQHVERRRPCINPNNSFFKQLIEFEIEVHGICSISMILDDATKSYIPDIYECKFKDRLCCQLKLCQRRHYGTH